MAYTPPNNPRSLRPEDAPDFKSPEDGEEEAPGFEFPTTKDDAYTALTEITAQREDARRRANAAVSAATKAGHSVQGTLSGGLYYEAPGAGGAQKYDPATDSYVTEGGGKTIKVPVGADATYAFNHYDGLRNDIATEWGVKLTGPAATGSSYVDTEEDKANEVRREFVDFMDRAKVLYGLEDAESGYAENAIKANIEQEKAVKQGLLDPGMRTWFATRRPESLSGLLRPSLPDEPISPFYSRDRSLGMGPDEGFTDPDYDSLGNYSGYAAGTDALPGGVDPELEALIGRPDFVVTGPPKGPVPASWRR